MPESQTICRAFRRSVVRIATASWGLFLLVGCSETVAPVADDVFDPLLHLDATVAELPNWQEGGDAKSGDTGSTADGAVECPAGATKVDGTCCTSGKYWDSASANCLPAGPSSCFPTGTEDPGACIPRWCFAYVDDAQKPCAPGPEDCRAVTAACPANAAEIQIGCEAGLAPELNCTPAGNVVLPSANGAQVVWGEATALPALPTLTTLPAAPSAPGPVAAPVWCYDGAGAVLDASNKTLACVTTACAIGTRPDAASPGACVQVSGPAWSCPPGFDVAGDACAPHPADCTDPWGGVTPGANVVFVAAAAAAGGDGSQAAPFQKVADAVAALSKGGTIAIGAGIYPNTNVTLTQSIALRGACAKDVILQGAPGSATVLIADQGSSSVSHLTVTGGRYGVRAEGKVTAMVDHVYVHSAAQGGIYVLDGAAATVKNTFVYTTLPGDNNGSGRGLDVQGATLDASNVRLSANRDFGLYGADATLTTNGLVVDGTLAQLSDNKHGFGVYVVGKSSWVASDVRVTNNRGYGVRLEESVSANGSNWWIDQTQPSGDQKDGIGLGIFTSALKIADLRVTKNRSHGIWVVDTDASFAGHNVLVSGTQPQALDGTAGQGVVVEGTGASAQFSGLYVQDSYTQGVNVAGKGATLGLDFALIANTQPRNSDKASGGGVEIVDGAKLILPPDGLVHIAGSYTTGLLLSNASWQGGTIRVQDTHSSAAAGLHGEGAIIESGSQVSDATLGVANSQYNGIVIVSATTNVKNAVLESSLTLPRTSDGTGGGGILIAEGAHVQGRVKALGSRDYGVALEGKGTTLDATTTDGSAGVIVGFTLSTGIGHGGHGLQIQAGAALTATGLRVQNSLGHGIFLYDAGSTLTASHVEISQTEANDAPGWGRGISISHGAKAQLTDLHVQSSQDVGVFVSDGGTTAAIDDLIVDGGTRGVAIQTHAVVTGHRWRLQNNSEVALYASGAGARLTLRDLAIHGGGYGVEVHGLASARVSRAAVTDGHGIGLLVDGKDATGAASALELFDARVSDVAADAVGPGHCVVAQAGGNLRVAGLREHGCAGAGVLSHDSVVNIGGASISDAATGGIRVVNGDLKLSGSRILGVTSVAFSQSGGTSTIGECAFVSTTPDTVGSSNGMDITTNATAALARVVVAGNQTAGIVLVASHATGDGVRSSSNGEGLARESGATDLWVNSLFYGNKFGDIVDPGDVAPVALPEVVTTLTASETP